ncbi:hypothetical protein SLEP1_g40465 [Rubroshorea leprosula]|uniref:Protein BIC1 n=1 Tax=Rubroshorea leprosula TaxID=152421 RepID=A0AAV5L3S3_9ROSI|nr:hypothetical protein SLEP1_g40465 [Rubroshorea leprosula]
MNTEQTQKIHGGISIEPNDPGLAADKGATHHDSDEETQSLPESSSKTQQCGKKQIDNVQGLSSEGMSADDPLAPLDVTKDVAATPELESEDNGRERLKRHRVEVAGRVWIPEIWGQEEFLKDWIDCSAFDESLVPNGIVPARTALAREGRPAKSGRLRIENRC